MTQEQKEKAIWVLAQALELYDKGESLHWATDARVLLAELQGNAVIGKFDCGCVVIKSPDGLFSIVGQDEGIRENPLSGQFGYSDITMAKATIRGFCPHRKVERGLC